VCKKLIKNSQPFGKKFQKTVGKGFFLTHTGHVVKNHNLQQCAIQNLQFIRLYDTYILMIT